MIALIEGWAEMSTLFTPKLRLARHIIRGVEAGDDGAAEKLSWQRRARK